ARRTSRFEIRREDSFSSSVVRVESSSVLRAYGEVNKLIKSMRRIRLMVRTLQLFEVCHGSFDGTLSARDRAGTCKKAWARQPAQFATVAKDSRQYGCWQGAPGKEPHGAGRRESNPDHGSAC